MLMKKIWIGLLALLLLLCIASLFLDVVGIGGAPVSVSIPEGSSASQIAYLLKEKGVIRFPSVFTLYARSDAAHLRAGLHSFTKSMGYKKVLAELCRDVPPANAKTVTIPEGYEVREIATLLEREGIVGAADFMATAKSAYKDFAFLPKDGNLEGYLFPATYQFLAPSSAETVLHVLLSTFEERMYTSTNLARCRELSLSFHEALTMASIIEREAAKSEERKTVASVFYNRLEKNMRLESCATVQYILKERKPVLSNRDTRISSPYNTYQNAGLPPAPIASPGEASMEAALYPAETDYLFFVADGSGGHTFSKTFAEHLAAQ